jgi:hypothetical protein
MQGGSIAGQNALRNGDIVTSDRGKDVAAGHSEVRDKDKPLLDGITVREGDLVQSLAI